MAARRFVVLVLLQCAGQAAGVSFRSFAQIVNDKAAVAAVQTGSKEASRAHAEEVHRVAGLLDVERDLETDKKKDDSSLRELESNIVALVRKRDAAKRDEARKDREIAFLQNQMGRVQSSVTAEASAEVAQESALGGEQKVDLNVDAAIASADQVVQQAEQADTVGQRADAKVVSSEAAEAAVRSAEAAQAAQASKVAQAEAALTRRSEAKAAERAAAAQAQAAAAAAASAAHAEAEAEAEQKRKAEAQQESRATFEARIRQEAEDKARIKIQAEQEAETRIRAESEAKMRVKIEAENAAKKKAQQEAEETDRQRAQEEDKKKNALADSADDSFKDFMKEEDGEDQMGDSDYEDSANALAGAIGWDRKKIEKNADSAVKQLTEAIGGKKVVKSLQGMMAGVR